MPFKCSLTPMSVQISLQRASSVIAISPHALLPGLPDLFTLANPPCEPTLKLRGPFHIITIYDYVDFSLSGLCLHLASKYARSLSPLWLEVGLMPAIPGTYQSRRLSTPMCTFDAVAGHVVHCAADKSLETLLRLVVQNDIFRLRQRHPYYIPRRLQRLCVFDAVLAEQ